MEELLEKLIEDCSVYTRLGCVADYIPELSKADPNEIGVHIITSDGRHSWAGDHETRFTIQSIVKPILLLQASLRFELAYRRRAELGRIMAVVPTRMGIGINSPALNTKGNSVAGIQLLEKLSQQLYLSIF